MSDPLHIHISCVSALAGHGVEPPKAWSELSGRFARYAALANPVTQRLVAEVVAPTGADIGALRAEALAEQAANSVDMASVTNVVASAVHSELARLYEPVAARNYKLIADRFDRAARSFTTAAGIVDPDINSDAVINLDERARSAWLNVAVLAGELDELMPILCAAAVLAGLDPVAVGGSEAAQPFLLALCVDFGKAHRRKAWQSWQSVGRCGRWAQVRQLGTIRAASRPARLTPYAECPPFTAKWVPSPRGGHTQEYHDPCDDEQQGIIGRVKEAVDAIWE